MAEKPKTEGLKTMIESNSQKKGDSQNSVKDQVKQALLRNRTKAQNSEGTASSPANKIADQIRKAQQKAQGGGGGQKQATNQPQSGSGNQNPAQATPIVSKIERTVDSINEVHSTMESLNNNMNLFVDLFNKRGASLGTDRQPAQGSVANATESDINPQTSTESTGQQGQNAVTSLLLTNLLKKTDNEDGQKLADLQKGSREYLDLLIKKLDQYQHEYELLQYLFEPKMFNDQLQPSEDAQGNSAWLAGFMSMMLKKNQ